MGSLDCEGKSYTARPAAVQSNTFFKSLWTASIQARLTVQTFEMADVIDIGQNTQYHLHPFLLHTMVQ